MVGILDTYRVYYVKHKIKENFLRVLLSDSTPVEFIGAIYAIAQSSPKLFGIPQDRVLAWCVVATSALRLYAVLINHLLLRLIASYIITFVWSYFVLFVWLEQPSEMITAGTASVVLNLWVAWRLQTEAHMYKKAASFKQEMIK
jgi:small-conductance mechanosensitive channel